MSPFTNLNVITVSGKFLLSSNVPAQGRVEFTPTEILTDTNANEIIYPTKIIAKLKLDGSFSIDLPAINDPDLSPVGWSYLVSERINNSKSGRDYYIQIDYLQVGGTIDLADIEHVVPNTEFSSSSNVGVGDTIRIYNSSGSQHLPNGAYTKVTLFNNQATPANGWQVNDYGDLSGGTTFEWDASNDRIKVLRSCIVQPFVNADITALDIPVVVQSTGKVNTSQPYISYVVRRVTTALGMNDALLVPGTPAIGSAFGYGGGNLLLPSFPVPAGEYLEFFMGVFSSAGGVDLIYSDLNLRNISNLG